MCLGAGRGWGISWRRSLSRLTDYTGITPRVEISLYILHSHSVLHNAHSPCTKLPRARRTIGLTTKAILCSYPHFCPDGLFLLSFYSSLPEQSPAPFLAFTRVTFIMCRESKSLPFCSTAAVPPLQDTAGLGAAADTGRAFPDSSRTKTQPLITQNPAPDHPIHLLWLFPSCIHHQSSCQHWFQPLWEGKRAALGSSTSNLFCWTPSHRNAEQPQAPCMGYRRHPA